MSDDKPREFWLWNKNKAITLEESVYKFPNPNKEHIHVIEYAAYEKLKNFCKCGGVIFADTEDWPCPMCHECYVFVTAERDAAAALKMCEEMAGALERQTHPHVESFCRDRARQALDQYNKFKMGME